MGDPINRSTLIAAQTNLVNGEVSDGPILEAAVETLFDYGDAKNTEINAHIAAATLPHADGSVTGPKLASSSVTDPKLATGAVLSRSLASNSVITDKIANQNITEPKMANNAVSSRTIQQAAVQGIHLDPSLTTQISNIATQAKFQQVDAQLEDISLNVSSFGAVGDGITDDTAALQSVFDAVYTYVTAGVGVTILFPHKKRFVISSKLTFIRHKFCKIVGNGSFIKVSDSVNTSSPIDIMIDMQSELGLFYVGFFTMDGITLDGNNRSEKIINGFNSSDSNNYGLYQTYFHDTSFRGIRENGWAIYGISYGTKVTCCQFIGYGEDRTQPGQWKGTGIYLGNATNGVIIKDNNFARLTRGIDSRYATIKVIVKDNIFDHCRNSAVRFRYGGTVPVISDNYFEACGDETETVVVYNNQNVTGIKTCIVLTGAPTDLNSPMQGAVVTENTFASCNTNELISADNIYGLRIQDNVLIYNTSPINSVLKLLKYGIGNFGRRGDYGAIIENNVLEIFYDAGYTNGRKMVSKIMDTSSLIVSNVVDFGLGAGLMDIVIKNFTRIHPNIGRIKMVPLNLYNRNFITDKNRGKFADWSVSRETVGSELVYIFKLLSNSTTNEVDVNPAYFERLKGQYIRIFFETGGSQSGAMVRFGVADGVTTTTYLPYGSQTNKSDVTNYIPMNFVHYVDPSATKLAIRIGTFASVGQEVWIKNFSISPAYYDIGIDNPMEQIVEGTTAPTTGSWVSGDIIRNPSPTAGGYADLICVSSGTPGTWKGTGLIET